MTASLKQKVLEHVFYQDDNTQTSKSDYTNGVPPFSKAGPGSGSWSNSCLNLRYKHGLCSCKDASDSPKHLPWILAPCGCAMRGKWDSIGVSLVWCRQLPLSAWFETKLVLLFCLRS